MKLETRLVRSKNNEDFEETLNLLLEEIDKQNFDVVDIKYQHTMDGVVPIYSALVLFKYREPQKASRPQFPAH